MLSNATTEKLLNMRLSAMADAYINQSKDPNFERMSFEERFGLIVDIEWHRRKNNQLKKLILDASFNQNHACVEDIDYRADRKLNKDLILRLASCNYIHESNNVIVMGASGNGKTYIACALGMSACRCHFTTKYIRLPELLNELAVARGEGIFKKVIAQYKKVKLLILDEWLLVSLRETEARDLLEIIEARHNNASTIFCSQFDPVGWHEKIGEDTIADAILDRIIHNSYKIVVDGIDSMRKYKGLKE